MVEREKMEIQLVEEVKDLRQRLSGLKAVVYDHRQTMAALRESEERYRIIGESISDYAFSASFREDGSFYLDWMTDSFTKVTGYAIAELDGKANFSQIYIHPEDFPRVLEVIKTGKPEQTLTYTCRIIAKSGEVRWIETHARQVVNGEGRMVRFHGAARDITERKQAEEQQRRYVARLALLHEIDRAILRTQSPETIAQVVLPRLRRMVPCERIAVGIFRWRTRKVKLLAVDVTGKTALPTGAEFPLVTPSYVDPDAYDMGLPQEIADLQALDPITPALRIVRDEGIRSFLMIPLMGEGAAIGMMSVGRNTPGLFSSEEKEIIQEVTASLGIVLHQARLQEKVRAQNEQLERQVSERTAALEESRRLVRQIADTTPNLLYLYDLIDQQYVYVNQKVVQVLGYTAETLLARGVPFVMARIHSDDLAHVSAQLGNWNVVQDGEVIECEFRIRNAQGEWRWLHSREMVFCRTANGAPKQIVGTSQDITEQKRAEEEQRKLQTQLFQNQKLQSLGRLAGGIAHDFNNLLTPILGFTELTLAEIPQGSEWRESLEEVKKAGRRAQALVRQILAFSRPHPQERRSLSVGALVEETLPLMRASFPTSITLRYCNTSATDVVWADATQLQQVLMNLCVNARDAMREKGGLLEITVTNALVNEAFAQEHEPLAPGPYVKLSVHDTGGGIAPDILPHIFDPFFTTKVVGEGSGLGLSIVHGIVAGHGGVVTVENGPGPGAVFAVYLRQTADALECMGNDNRPALNGRGCVLLVDDEDPVARLGKRMLERCGYQVVMTTSSTDALKIFRQTPEAFTAVITDQTMPELTGTALAQALLQIRPELPVLLCSGFSEELTLERRKPPGVSEYLQKPFSLEELSAALQRILTHAKAARNENESVASANNETTRLSNALPTYDFQHLKAPEAEDAHRRERHPLDGRSDEVFPRKTQATPPARADGTKNNRVIP